MRTHRYFAHETLHYCDATDYIDSPLTCGWRAPWTAIREQLNKAVIVLNETLAVARAKHVRRVFREQIARYVLNALWRQLETHHSRSDDKRSSKRTKTTPETLNHYAFTFSEIAERIGIRGQNVGRVFEEKPNEWSHFCLMTLATQLDFSGFKHPPRRLAVYEGYLAAMLAIRSTTRPTAEDLNLDVVDVAYLVAVEASPSWQLQKNPRLSEDDRLAVRLDVTAKISGKVQAWIGDGEHRRRDAAALAALEREWGWEYEEVLKAVPLVKHL